MVGEGRGVELGAGSGAAEGVANSVSGRKGVAEGVEEAGAGWTPSTRQACEARPAATAPASPRRNSLRERLFSVDNLFGCSPDFNFG